MCVWTSMLCNGDVDEGNDEDDEETEQDKEDVDDHDDEYVFRAI